MVVHVIRDCFRNRLRLETDRLHFSMYSTEKQDTPSMTAFAPSYPSLTSSPCQGLAKPIKTWFLVCGTLTEDFDDLFKVRGHSDRAWANTTPLYLAVLHCSSLKECFGRNLIWICLSSKDMVLRRSVDTYAWRRAMSLRNLRAEKPIECPTL